MIQIARELESFGTDFDRMAERATPTWLGTLRRQAMDRFGALGLPTTRLEDWKYTSVAPIGRVPWHLASGEAASRVTADAIAPYLFCEPDWPRLVFVDGQYAPALSAVHGLPAGARVQSLGAALAEDAAAIQPVLARHADWQAHGFTALNTAFLADGALIWLPRGAAIETPIHLVFAATGADDDTVSHPRVLVVLGAGSAATVLESYVSLAPGRHLTNAVSELVLEQDAALTHYQVLRESARAYHVGTTQVHQARDSRLASYSFALSADLARNDLNVRLTGEGAECSLTGLYLVTGTQHVDYHTTIDHLVPHGTSREFYKGVLDGKARAVFNGKVVVHPNATQSDAQQVNRNLLLSTDATVDTKPQLEIFNDDVKCTHGAAVGQLDADAIFYLRSRGIGDAAARRILTVGFAGEVTDRVPLAPVHTALADLLFARLAAGALDAGDLGLGE